MTPEQLSALRDELTNDPLGVGYAAMADDDAAKSINEPTRQADRESLTAVQLVSALDETEYNAAPARGKAYFSLLVDAGGVDLNPLTKSQLGTVFPAGSATRANLLALLKRTGTRAEELGLGRVTPSDIADAKRL